MGIIGIVAALTMPALIVNYQKKVRINQLKSSVSILENGFRKIIADEGVTNFDETTIFEQMYLDRESIQNRVEIALMQKYFNAVITVPYSLQVAEGWPAGNNQYTGEICTKFVGKGSAWYYKDKKTCVGLRQNVYKLANGSLLRSGFFTTNSSYPNQGKLKRVVSEATIDINAEKGPNVFGQDVFEFSVGNDGHLFPHNGKDYAYYYAAGSGGNYTFEQYYYLGKGKDGCVTGVAGRSCIAKIIEDGWEINY